MYSTQRNYKTLFSIATSGLLLTSCAFMQPAPPPAYDPNIAAAKQADSFINATDPKFLKPIDKLAVTSCNVMFAEVSAASASTSSGIFGNVDNNRVEAKVSVLYTMTGLSDADMQSMADRICADAEAKLTAQGFDVISYATMKATSPAFVSLQSAGKPSPFIFNSGKTKYKVFTRSGDSIFEERYIGMGSGLAQAFKAAKGTSAWQFEALAMDELKASAVNINLLVDFAELQSDGSERAGGMINKNSANITTKVEMSVVGDVRAKPYKELNCWKRFGNRECGVNKFTILNSSRPISLTDTFYSSINNATTLGDSVASGFSKAMSLIGGGASVDITRYEVAVKPEAFDAASGKAANAFLEMTSHKMATLKAGK